MTQKAVENLIGRLVTDREFRRRFFEEPAAACLDESIDVTPRELQAVARLEPAVLEQFGKQLDRSIVRATVGVAQPNNSRRRPWTASVNLRGAK